MDDTDFDGKASGNSTGLQSSSASSGTGDTGGAATRAAPPAPTAPAASGGAPSAADEEKLSPGDIVDRWFNTKFPGSPVAEHWAFLYEAKEELKAQLS